MHNNIESLFLTGGTGFFGRSILRHLSILNDKHENPIARVMVLARSPATFLEQYPEFRNLSWLSFYAGDILMDLSDFPLQEKFTHVLHAATDSTIGPQIAPLDRYDQIITGTRNVLDFAVRVGVKKFLLTSSGGVYGVQPPHLDSIPETYNGIPDPMSAENVYSISKRTAEHLCALYQQRYGVETIVARCFAFVGPDLPLNAHFAIGNFIRDALERSEISVNGNGTPVRSYLYQDDLAKWLLTLLAKGTPSEAYNVGSDQAISIADLAHLVRDIISPEKKVVIQKSTNADVAVRHRYVPNINKACSQFDLKVRTSLAEAIRKTEQEIRKRTKWRNCECLTE